MAGFFKPLPEALPQEFRIKDLSPQTIKRFEAVLHGLDGVKVCRTSGKVGISASNVKDFVQRIFTVYAILKENDLLHQLTLLL